MYANIFGVTVLFYANGGPAPATKLLAVDAPNGGDWLAWRTTPAWRWEISSGWQRSAMAQSDIKWAGEYGIIDESEVLDVQYEILVRAEQFQQSSAPT